MRTFYKYPSYGKSPARFVMYFIHNAIMYVTTLLFLWTISKLDKTKFYRSVLTVARKRSKTLVMMLSVLVINEVDAIEPLTKAQDTHEILMSL